MLPDRSVSTYATLAEVASDYSTSVQNLRRLIAAGELPAYRLNKRGIRVKRADVEALLTRIPAIGA